jgi:hypothetical protein
MDLVPDPQVLTKSGRPQRRSPSSTTADNRDFIEVVSVSFGTSVLRPILLRSTPSSSPPLNKSKSMRTCFSHEHPRGGGVHRHPWRCRDNDGENVSSEDAATTHSRVQTTLGPAMSEIQISFRTRQTTTKKTPWLLVRKRTIPTERPPPVDEI